MSSLAQVNESESSSFFTSVAEKCKRYSLLAGQVCILALDILFFIGKVSDNLPKAITRGSLLALSSVGLISLPYTIDFILKTKKAAEFAFEAKNYVVMGISSLRVIELISNVGLLAASFFASLVGFLGDESLQMSIYYIAAPWGYATLVLSIFLLISYLYLDYVAINELKGDQFNVKADGIVGGLIAKKKQWRNIPANPYLAAHIRACMDKDTFSLFKKQLKKLDEDDVAKRREIVKIAYENIVTQQQINLGGQVALNFLGYTLSGVQKYYTPNSIVSASINLVMASLYSIKLGVETVREIYQRLKIEVVATNSN